MKYVSISSSYNCLTYSQIITNDGDGYDASTGIFTCSEAGVYMLTFSIGQRDQGHYMWAELMLNSKNLIDAVVDTYHPSQVRLLSIFFCNVYYRFKLIH